MLLALSPSKTPGVWFLVKFCFFFFQSFIIPVCVIGSTFHQEQVWNNVTERNVFAKPLPDLCHGIIFFFQIKISVDHYKFDLLEKLNWDQKKTFYRLSGWLAFHPEAPFLFLLVESIAQPSSCFHFLNQETWEFLSGSQSTVFVDFSMCSPLDHLWTPNKALLGASRTLRSLKPST